MKTARQQIVFEKISLAVCGSFLALFLLLVTGVAGFTSSSAAASKQVLTQSDFRYVGAFLMPVNLSNSPQTDEFSPAWRPGR